MFTHCTFKLTDQKTKTEILNERSLVRAPSVACNQMIADSEFRTNQFRPTKSTSVMSHMMYCLAELSTVIV